MGMFENGETMTNHDKYNTKTGRLVSTGMTPNGHVKREDVDQPSNLGYPIFRNPH